MAWVAWVTVAMAAIKKRVSINYVATFACDGKKFELSPGGFNFMPTKMLNEAWLPAHSLTFITVDNAWDVNWVEGPPTKADPKL
jgi:hypothetical protein